LIAQQKCQKLFARLALQIKILREINILKGIRVGQMDGALITKPPPAAIPLAPITRRLRFSPIAASFVSPRITDTTLFYHSSLLLFWVCQSWLIAQPYQAPPSQREAAQLLINVNIRTGIIIIKIILHVTNFKYNRRI
jgi:hypothetical protein